MRLLELKVRNILGLREASIKFDPGAVAIVGPNGAGKSSILDSLVLALFGSPTPVRVVNNLNVIRMGSSEGRVICTFVKNGEVYRITRKFKGPKGQQEALLEKGGDDGGKWDVIASNVKEVNGCIAKVLSPFADSMGDANLSKLRDAFISTVFVPQGMVTKFVDVSPGERWQILTASLGLESESKLQEKVRRIVQIATAEIENVKGSLQKVEDFLNKLPTEEEIRRDLKSVGRNLKSVQDRLVAFKKSIDTKNKLVELEEQIKRLSSEHEEASALYKNIYDEYRLYEANQALKGLISVSKHYRELNEKINSLESNIQYINKKIEPKIMEVNKLRVAYKNIYLKMQNINKYAQHKDEALKLLDLAEGIKFCKAEIELIEADIAKNNKSLDELSKRRRRLYRQKLERSLCDVIQEHKNIAHTMVRTLEAIRSRLIDWVKQLAPDGAVDFERFKGVGAIEVARSLVFSDLGEALSEWGKAKNRTLTLLQEGRRLREEIRSLGFEAPRSELSVREIDALLGELEDNIRKQELKKHQLMGSLEKNLKDMKKMCQVAKNLEEVLGGLLPEDVVKAAKERERFLKELEEIRNKGDSLNSEIEELKEKKRKLEGELAQAEWQRENAKNALRDAAENFRELCRKHGLTQKDKTKLMYRDGMTHCSKEEVEDARRRLDLSRDLLSRAKVEFRDFKLKFETTLPPLETLTNRKQELEEEEERLKSVLNELQYNLRQKEGLEKEKGQMKEKYNVISQAFDVAIKLQKYTDGRNFVRFLSDTILGELLSAVNKNLSFKGFSLVAERGNLYVTSGGYRRDAASLSGGERAMVSLMMLRHLANRVGFKQILFIDEGLAMLDDGNLEMMMELFDNLGKEAFVGVITHDMDFASLFPRRIEVEKGVVSMIKR
ncbi:exonuclease SbcC [Acetomicrobium thermoterrenum DSM 13490]|uniref:Exonuclease SbcC n=1 Tax=Acetomicrobium thermoterrenum DSM 13490 TaxID=1120987 RepID=A0A1H3HAG4_9BACT|nr:SMC family ATPase [Acetomicrobium thermoterrenum]SDY12583.1 exonuclease SbcC [Acetomicrobium thermoterrenum DSM 13490]